MPSLRSFVLGWANAKQTIGTIRFDHNWCFYHCHHHHEKGWCCWWWKWWSKFAIAEWQRKTKFTILSNFKQSCAMIVQWWGKLCKVHLPDGDSKRKSGQTSNDPVCKQCKGATGVKSQKCQRSTKSLAKPIKKPTFPRMTHHRHHPSLL